MIKTLHLTLIWKWFDLIDQGKKKVEYRNMTPYWISRLRSKGFDEVLFRNGYGKHRPSIKRECLGITENHDTNEFEIHLGNDIPIQP